MVEVAFDGRGDKRIVEIEDRILDAINVLLRRACGDDPSRPVILDKKGSEKLEASGVVQDCEFGLMVLMAEDWLSGSNRIKGELADEDKLKTLIAALVKSTVENVTARSGPAGTYSFGRGRLPNNPVFFSGAPYTFYKDEKRKAFVSANLDAAMLIIAFLAAALEKYDELLNDAPYIPSEELKSFGASTLRDAALFVCNEGLQYAIGCRVVREDNTFDGFTCDPETNIDPRFSLRENDRLFFTWTTCETVNELLKWETYLDRLAVRPAAPSIIGEVKSHLNSLRGDLEKASQWCYDTFFSSFSKILELPPRIGPVVIEIGDLGPEAELSEALQAKCKEIEAFVLHVYHVSQYAAIRSIRPVSLKVDEVRQILLLLDNLVSQHILGTGLDTARHEDLYRTLTRYYSLGVTSNTMYRDDAYFPLIVRSLSGLLSRTIDSLDASGRDTQDLVKGFDLSLQKYSQNLLMRQAKEQDGDAQLWSIMTGKPYVLYATQRTVFALIEYMKFILKMEEPDEEESKDSLRDLLTKSLAEALLAPVINSVLDKYPHLDPSKVPAPAQDHLPEPIWARRVISSWLDNFTEEFRKQKLQEKLSQFAAKLSRLRNGFRRRRPSKQSTQIEKAHAVLKEAIENIFNLPEVGPKLRALDEGDHSWEAEILLPVLFEHMFSEHTKTGRSLADLATVEGNDLWKQIEEAQGIVKSIS